MFCWKLLVWCRSHVNPDNWPWCVIQNGVQKTLQISGLARLTNWRNHLYIAILSSANKTVHCFSFCEGLNISPFSRQKTVHGAQIYRFVNAEKAVWDKPPSKTTIWKDLVPIRDMQPTAKNHEEDLEERTPQITNHLLRYVGSAPQSCPIFAAFRLKYDRHQISFTAFPVHLLQGSKLQAEKGKAFEVCRKVKLRTRIYFFSPSLILDCFVVHIIVQKSVLQSWNFCFANARIQLNDFVVSNFLLISCWTRQIITLEFANFR